MNSWLTKPFKKLRKRAGSQEFTGLVVPRTVLTDLHTIWRTGRSWEARARETPAELVIETTNICNANCIFCGYQYQDLFRQQKGVMTEEVFEKALHDFSAMGGEAIDFTPLVGDAFVDPNIIARIRRAKELGFRVFFYTNGILLNRIDQEEFLRTGVDLIMISTAPLDPESHEQIYRTKKYDELLQGVHRLLKLRSDLGIEVEFNINFRAHISLAETLAKPDFREYVLPYLTEKEIESINILVRRYDSWGGLIKEDEMLGEMRLARPPKLKSRPCDWTFGMMVLYDGSVRACSCRFTGSNAADADDGLLVGDIKQESLAEIWQGERIRQLRRRFGAKDLPQVCQSCSMYRPG